MVKQFCLNADNCGRRHYQYLNDEPSLCDFCIYEQEKKKEKEKDVVVVKRRSRSDTVGNFDQEHDK
jgi:hypothetical protein